eukprot:3058752-Amphidinium_carterae.1
MECPCAPSQRKSKAYQAVEEKARLIKLRGRGLGASACPRAHLSARALTLRGDEAALAAFYRTERVHAQSVIVIPP